jgi:hypothetical protein
VICSQSRYGGYGYDYYGNPTEPLMGILARQYNRSRYLVLAWAREIGSEQPEPISISWKEQASRSSCIIATHPINHSRVTSAPTFFRYASISSNTSGIHRHATTHPLNNQPCYHYPSIPFLFAVRLRNWLEDAFDFCATRYEHFSLCSRYHIIMYVSIATKSIISACIPHLPFLDATYTSHVP